MNVIRVGTILFFLTLTVMGQALLSARPEGDEFYPDEEATERREMALPRLRELRADSAVLEWQGEPSSVLRVGERSHEWELVAVIDQSPPLAVLERDFPRWGVLAYVGTAGPVATMRKAVGRLDSLQAGKALPPDYSDRILNAQADVLGLEATPNGDEPSYQALAGLLPPLRTYTFLGTTSSRLKVIVWPDGRLGLGVRDRKLDGVLFDPAARLGIPLSGSFLATKQGLIGGHLPVIDYGYSGAAHSRYEEIAFGAGGEELQTFVCLRSNEGKRTFWRLPGNQPLANGSEFYRALLAVQQEWERFFTQGMSVEIPEARVSDSTKAAIVRALISEVGLQPKYGVGKYSAAIHDTFPPTTILLNGCLLDWGFTAEVKARLAYYLTHFVRPDGTFDYYGPALSEYGQMLTLAARYVQVTGDTRWLQENLPALQRITGSIELQVDASRHHASPASPDYGLLYGAAEADTREDKRFYFSSATWCWRGLEEMGHLLSEVGQRNRDASLEQLGNHLLTETDTFRGSVLAALGRAFQKNAMPAFLPPDAGPEKPFERMTENELASYSNYRYWPEMLSSGLLPPELRDAVINYRTSHGGEVGGTTRLEDVLDDWPYANYAWGLLEAGQIEHYLLGFYGHLAFHQAPGTFTAYESVAIKGASTRDYSGDYCVPTQLVGPQMLRWMIAWEPWDSKDLWLGRAVPEKWFETGFSARHIPTQWGPIDFAVVPNDKGFTAQVEIASPHPELHVHIFFRTIPKGEVPKVTVQGVSSWKWNASEQAVVLSGAWNRVVVTINK